MRESHLKAVLLDVDGTLYRPEPLRLHMALLLIGDHLPRPWKFWPTLKIILAFRRAQEQLRRQRGNPGDLAKQQYQLAAQITGRPLPEVEAIVSRWMFERPLDALPRCARAGLKRFLNRCRAQGLKLGALSDYPPQAKLTALGVAKWFDLQLCSTSAQIGAFKPAPDGILYACRQWGIAPQTCLYIGDRAEVDQLAAQRAGAGFMGMGPPSPGLDKPSVKDFIELIQLMGI